MDWTVRLVDAIARGPLWPKCAIFITWDHWGGWADHVDPPPLEQWTDGTQFFPGGRVGCIAISPYAKRNYISKARHTHVSLLKFCETIFGLPTINARDAASDGMEDCFDFTSPPNLTLPIASIAPGPAPALKKISKKQQKATKNLAPKLRKKSAREKEDDQKIDQKVTVRPTPYLRVFRSGEVQRRMITTKRFAGIYFTSKKVRSSEIPPVGRSLGFARHR